MSSSTLPSIQIKEAQNSDSGELPSSTRDSAVSSLNDIVRDPTRPSQTTLQLASSATSDTFEQSKTAVDKGASQQRSQPTESQERAASPTAIENMADTPEEVRDAGRLLVNITELLENVLLFLPGADIARSRQVSKQFMSKVQLSKKLQSKLFTNLAPVPITELLMVGEPSKISQDIRWAWRPDTAVIGSVHPTPMLQSKRTASWPRTEPRPTTTLLHVKDAEPMLNWQPGPWQDQFLTQPPCQKVSIFYKLDGRGRRELQSTEGFTLGMLCQCFQSIRDSARERIAGRRGKDVYGEDLTDVQLRQVDVHVRNFLEEDSEEVVKARMLRRSVQRR